MQPEKVLINYVYWPAMGHCVEALRYAYGYHLANPDKQISILLNSHTPFILAELMPWLKKVYTVDVVNDKAPFSSKLYAGIPTEWDYIISDPRGESDDKYASPGTFNKHFQYVKNNFVATKARGVIADACLPYRPHANLTVTLPDNSIDQAAKRLLNTEVKIAVLLTGGSYPKSFWPSAGSWVTVLKEIQKLHQSTSFYFIGKSIKSGILTPSRLAPGELRTIVDSFPNAVNCFDLDLLQQLAITKLCGLLISPHSGFGFAASMVNTPWLTISGGRWPEYFFNGTPFYSVLPDPRKYPCFDDAFNKPAKDDDGTMRIPSMRRQRILDDLDEIAAASQLLLSRKITYRQSLKNHFLKMEKFYSGAKRVESFDDIHKDFIQK